MDYTVTNRIFDGCAAKRQLQLQGDIFLNYLGNHFGTRGRLLGVEGFRKSQRQASVHHTLEQWPRGLRMIMGQAAHCTSEHWPCTQTDLDLES